MQWKNPDAEKDQSQKDMLVTEDKMFSQHDWLSAYEF